VRDPKKYNKERDLNNRVQKQRGIVKAE
jgi:hypothetical protein